MQRSAQPRQSGGTGTPGTPAGGFTLLEVLVAVVVLSVGMLGLAQLQALGLRSNLASSFRADATYYATQMAERMHANLVGANANAYANLSTAAVTNCAARPNPFCASRFNGTTIDVAQTCTAAQMATFDNYLLACGTDGSMARGGVKLLPQGSATVVCNDSTVDTDPCTDGSSHTVTVNWQELDPKSGATVAQRVVLTFQP